MRLTHLLVAVLFAFTTPSAVASENVLDVPAYEWRDGCTPTAVGMVVGYYDAHGFPELFDGDPYQMIASHSENGEPRHYEDYALPFDIEGLALDKSEPPVSDEHPSDCLADFMHTSWSSEGMFYGGTWMSKTLTGWADYLAYRGLVGSGERIILSPNTEERIAAVWARVKTEIDAGRPLTAAVDATADGGAEHTVALVGYRETGSLREYGCLDTFSTTVRWFEFRVPATTYGYGVNSVFTYAIADTKPPVTTVLRYRRGTYFLSATDDSPPITTYYKIDDGEWHEGTVIQGAGSQPVFFYSVDAYGNTEPVQTG